MSGYTVAATSAGPVDWSVHPANRGALLTPIQSAVLLSCAGGAVYGFASGIIGGLQDPIIKGEFFPDESSSAQSLDAGILTACILLGAFVGCFLGVDAGNRWGRRVGVKIAGVIAVVCSILLAVVPSFAWIVVIRTFLGLSVGFVTALVPWYVTDSVPAARRGSIGTIFQINICGFILVAELVNYAFHPTASETDVYESPLKWKIQLALSVVPGFVVLLLGFIMHESPVYLASLADLALGDASTGALDVLGDNGDGEHHDRVAPPSLLDSLPRVKSPAAAQKLGWSDLFSRANIQWVFVGLILSSSNQLTGINAVIFYAPKIFQDAGFSNPLVLTFAVVGTWNLLSVFVSFALVDRVGRRPLMLGALFFMCLGSGLMALAYEAFPEHKAAPAIIAMILFIGAFECGPGPLFFLMAVETFPPELRDPALSLTQSTAWIFSIVVTFGFPVINNALGPAATFLVFSINCVIGFVLIWWRVPEPVKDAAVADAAVEPLTSLVANGDGYSPLSNA